MDLRHSLTPEELYDFLVHVAPIRPVCVWGPPGIGKSSIVARFFEEMSYDHEQFLGTLVAPEDIMGPPRLTDRDTSKFCPPDRLVRKEPFGLFLDELPQAEEEVQKAFFQVVHEHRLGDHRLPEGSIVIAAGNRIEDESGSRGLLAALINRFVHVELRADASQWIRWAHEMEIHAWVRSFIEKRPNMLQSSPPKTQQPFSTPRSWHLLSDALHEYKEPTMRQVELLASGLLTPEHVPHFTAHVKAAGDTGRLARILKGEEDWPRDPKDRDVLYDLANQLAGKLESELPAAKGELSERQKQEVHHMKGAIARLAEVSAEACQAMIGRAEFPEWFVTELARDLPRIFQKSA